jgi:hypothetical protein
MEVFSIKYQMGQRIDTEDLKKFIGTDFLMHSWAAAEFQ